MNTDVAAAEGLISEVSWPRFCALQIWLLIALLLYNAAVELGRYFRTGSMRKALLGIGPEKG